MSLSAAKDIGRKNNDAVHKVPSLSALSARAFYTYNYVIQVCGEFTKAGKARLNQLNADLLWPDKDRDLLGP